MSRKRVRHPVYREPPPPPDDRKIVVEALSRIIQITHDELAVAEARTSGYYGDSTRDREARADALREKVRALRRIRQDFEAAASSTEIDPTPESAS